MHSSVLCFFHSTVYLQDASMLLCKIEVFALSIAVNVFYCIAFIAYHNLSILLLLEIRVSSLGL